MNRPLDDATRTQIKASDPTVSTWVSANAGSGKTRVLTDRVARLLLAGAKPSRILGLTYTRAAAANMQNRLFATLGAWAMLDDAKLAEALQGLSEDAETYSAEDLARARTLFARALETPGGLKIQTIHAFCDALLRRFPLEAGVSPRFEELDDRSARLMIEEIRDRMAVAAEAGEDPAFDALADEVSETVLDDLVAAVLANRAAFREEDDAAIWAGFGLAPGTDAATLTAREAERLDAGTLARLAAALDHGGVNDKAAAASLRAAVAAAMAGNASDALAHHAAAFLRKDGEPRSTSKFPSAPTKKAAPWAPDEVTAQIELAAEIRETLLTIRAAARSAALHRFGRALLAEYDAEKARRGALDYDDLVEKTRRLLTRADMAAWALYKLDGGIDHVLVDEAQDTSPEQWEVIRALTEEFHAGAGARDVERTIFVVGDEKQSIYSFQGAEPRAFGENREYFEERIAASGDMLQKRTLEYSFRSSRPILRLVDTIFQGEAAEGLNFEGEPPRHLAFRGNDPGLVELWPFVPKPDAPEEAEWWRPVDEPAASDPKAVLAEAVAGEIRRMIADGDPLPVHRKEEDGGDPPPDHDDARQWRRTRPGDILVLVRRRDALARGIIRRLKSLGVAVAGQDRLSLIDELAVKDLLALLRVALEPADDLSLAAVLRSPLGGLGEDDLFALAHGRERTLFDALMARRDDWPEAAALVADLRDRVDYQRPYELLERALTGHDGRKRLVARLGREAEDPIDELLEQALAYEATEPPSLVGFLTWIEAAADLEIKREMQSGADEVRVMTVHGAKGLESAVVFLPDTGPRRASPRGRQVLRLGDDGPAVWGGAKKDAPGPLRDAIAAAEQREEEENRRLLYVALTRAEDRLVICGAGDEKQLPGTWYDMIRAGMEGCGAEEATPPPGLDGPALRLASGWIPPAEAAAGAGAPPEAALTPETPPAHAPAVQSVRRRSVTELAEAEAIDVAVSAGTDRAEARLRGDAVHLLLEAIASPEEDPRARALLAAAFPALDETAREECLAHALAALALPEARPFFAPEALSEAGLSFAPPDSDLRIAGRVDRLLVLPDRVDVLDIKTSAAPPPGPDAAPEAYLRQMALYRAALRRLYPGREIRAGLLWTAAPRLDWLPAGALDAAYRRALSHGLTGPDPLPSLAGMDADAPD